MIITIDGPVGTGKSTIAKRLAEALGFVYFDTGAMYRCVTYGIIKHHIDISNTLELKKFLQNFVSDIREENGIKRYYFEREEVTQQIRGAEVTSLVSKIAASPVVRNKLVDIQRSLASRTNTIVEGRDMGTVVFPNADLKIFLTAEPDVRAQRRYDELMQHMPDEAANMTFKDILQSIKKRDHDDSMREISPLKQAEDAHVIDTTHLSIEEVVEAILKITS